MAGRRGSSPHGRPEPIPAKGPDDQANRLQPVEARCIDFVIELLNQRIQSSEYECALVCALAVLRVSDHEADDHGRTRTVIRRFGPI